MWRPPKAFRFCQCIELCWAEALFAFGGCFLSPQLGRHCDRAPSSVMRRAAKEACNTLHRVCAKKLQKICWKKWIIYNHLILLILPLWESISLTSCILGAARVLVRTKRIFLLRRNKNMSPTHVSWIFIAAFLHLRGFCRWSSIAHWRQGFRVWTWYRLWRPILPSFFAFFLPSWSMERDTFFSTRSS